MMSNLVGGGLKGFLGLSLTVTGLVGSSKAWEWENRRRERDRFAQWKEENKRKAEEAK